MTVEERIAKLAERADNMRALDESRACLDLQCESADLYRTCYRAQATLARGCDCWGHTPQDIQDALYAEASALLDDAETQ